MWYFYKTNNSRLYVRRYLFLTTPDIGVTNWCQARCHIPTETDQLYCSQTRFTLQQQRLSLEFLQIFCFIWKKSVYVSMGQSRRVEMVTKRTIHILFCISFLAIAVNCEARSFDKGWQNLKPKVSILLHFTFRLISQRENQDLKPLRNKCS